MIPENFNLEFPKVEYGQPVTIRVGGEYSTNTAGVGILVTKERINKASEECKYSVYTTIDTIVCGIFTSLEYTIDFVQQLFDIPDAINGERFMYEMTVRNQFIGVLINREYDLVAVWWDGKRSWVRERIKP